jgi:hypothetical protein
MWTTDTERSHIAKSVYGAINLKNDSEKRYSTEQLTSQKQRKNPEIQFIATRRPISKNLNAPLAQLATHVVRHQGSHP